MLSTRFMMPTVVSRALRSQARALGLMTAAAWRSASSAIAVQGGRPSLRLPHHGSAPRIQRLSSTGPGGAGTAGDRGAGAAESATAGDESADTAAEMEQIRIMESFPGRFSFACTCGSGAFAQVRYTLARAGGDTARSISDAARRRRVDSSDCGPAPVAHL